MNRVIKFRGKRVVDKEWVYGYYSYDEFDDLHSISFYVEDGFEEYNVIPSTIGQFTGLHDKEGNEIYEGDIISHSHMEVEYKGWNGEPARRTNRFVHFSQGAWVLSDNEIWNMSIYSDMVKIGNVHDNPELLKS